MTDYNDASTDAFDRLKALISESVSNPPHLKRAQKALLGNTNLVLLPEERTTIAGSYALVDMGISNDEPIDPACFDGWTEIGLMDE